MGSIAAIFSADSGRRRRIQAMLSASPHRGRHTQVLELGRCALGVSNLDLLGTSQVACSEGLAIAFTGIVDNLDELSQEIQRGERRPPLPSVASALLQAFRAFGDEMPGKLRGAFAAILTDGAQLWCFRDHIGQYPLFYRQASGECLVATEARQILAGSSLSPEPDLEAVQRIFFGAYDADAPSALRGVDRVPAATIIRADDTGVRGTRYWNPERVLETANLTPDELRSRFDQVMQRAVDRSVTGQDVVSLSGGIDSPAVAAFAAPRHRALTGEAIAALTAVYPAVPSADERSYAELVARHFGMRFETYEQRARPLDQLATWARVMNGPVPLASAPEAEEHYRVAAGLGYRTMLTGEMAESVFAGSPYLLAHLLRHRRVRSFWHQLRTQHDGGASIIRLGRQVAAGVMPRRVAATYHRLRVSDRGYRIPAWLDGFQVKKEAAQSVAPAAERWRDQQLAATRRPELSLEVEELCQTMCGIRVRRPWADVDVWEFFLSLPAEVKFPGLHSKDLARSLLRGRVPDAILDRRDKTFFDANLQARIDYPALRRWLSAPRHRIAGVKYELLADRLDREDLEPSEIRWARDLAAVHAFLASW